MTREEAKEWLPIIQAWAEGKVIECRTKPSALSKSWQDMNEWTEIKEIEFWNNTEYRIKPEPKYRPFKNKEECWQEMMKHQPFGWVIGKIYANFHHIDFVYSCNPNNGYGVRLGNSTICTNFENMFKDFKFADGTPFGIKGE